ncbi:MAG: GFA family protein [Proteobacteria bacterium]|nr:GFA family protein [Pseudomonadota bacterium]
MRVDGQCHCGQITYVAEVDPATVMICNCTDCQTMAGSAFRTLVLTRPGTFRLLSGEPKPYVKTGDSGTRRIQSFCPECGTPIYSAPVDTAEPDIYVLRLGAVRQRDQLVPKVKLWTRSAQAWVDDMNALPKFETQPVFDDDGQLKPT